MPQIVLEFDVTNSYLLTAQITYNRREANNKILAFNSRDLQQRLIDEFNDMKIWDAAGEYQRGNITLRRRRASSPGMMAVGGFLRDFEPFPGETGSAPRGRVKV